MDNLLEMSSNKQKILNKVITVHFLKREVKHILQDEKLKTALPFLQNNSFCNYSVNLPGFRPATPYLSKRFPKDLNISGSQVSEPAKLKHLSFCPLESFHLSFKSCGQNTIFSVWKHTVYCVLCFVYPKQEQSQECLFKLLRKKTFWALAQLLLSLWNTASWKFHRKVTKSGAEKLL